MVHQCQLCGLRQMNFLGRFLKENPLPLLGVYIVQHGLEECKNNCNMYL